MVTRSNFKGKPCEWSLVFLDLCVTSQYMLWRWRALSGRIYALYIWSQVFLLAALSVGDFYSHFTNNETVSKKDLKSFTQDQVGKLDFGAILFLQYHSVSFLLVLYYCLQINQTFPLFKGNHPRLKYEIVFDPSSQSFHQHLLSTYYKLGIDIKNKWNIMPAVRKYSSSVDSVTKVCWAYLS